MLALSVSAFAQEYSSTADILFEAGKNYYEQGQYEQALQELGKALLAEPGHTLARMYIEIIEEELALAAAEKEIEIGIEIEEEAAASADDAARERAMIEAIEQAKSKVSGLEREAAEEEQAGEVMPAAAEVSEKLAEKAPEEQEIAEEPYPLLGKGKTFIELYNKYYWHNTEFDEGGERHRWAYNGSYHEVASELKLEYGLTDDLNFLCSIPYKEAVWKDDYNRNTTSGIGDCWMRLKYRVFRQAQLPWSLSLQPGFRFPGGYNENDSPSLGRGELAGELRLIATRSFYSLPCYAKIETGYRGRAEEPTDEIPMLLEWGYYPTDWLLFKTTVDGVEGLGGRGDVEEDYTKWTAHLIYSPKGGFKTFRKEGSLNFEFAYGNTFEGKNTSNGSEVVINISYQF